MPSIKEALANTKKNLAETRRLLGKESAASSSKNQPVKQKRLLPKDGKGISGTMEQLKERKKRLDDL
jgi:hypothetical protein